MVLEMSMFEGSPPIIFRKKQLASRALFCQRFKEIVRTLRKDGDVSQNTSSTESVPDHHTDTSTLEEQEGYATDEVGNDSSSVVDEDDVLPCRKTNVEYLYNNKLVGFSVRVHLNNLISPDKERLVRPICTPHVQFLEKSFEATPGGEFHMLVGNLISGEIERACESGGVKIEVVGGNHSRLALSSLYRRGLRGASVTCMVYAELSAEEALKIGIHHNTINAKSRPMSFVETVGVVRKVQEKRQLARIFGYESSKKVKDCLKVHLRLCTRPDDIIETVYRIDRCWSQKKPLSQTTLRNLLWLDDDNIRQGLTCLETHGLKAYKDLVKKMKGETATQISRPISAADEDKEDKDKEIANLNKALEDWKKKYECLNNKYSELTVKNQQLKDDLDELKNSNKRHHSEDESQETVQNAKRAKCFDVGQKVWAMYSKDQISYPARVMYITDKGYTVQFIQDRVMDNVLEANIRTWNGGKSC